MKKHFTFGATFKKMDEDEESVTIFGRASTNATDRVGDIIVSEAWNNGGLENYETNPIILFNHNYNKPIGTAVEIKSVQGGLDLKAEIIDPYIVHLIKKGVLNAFSVGFIPKDLDFDRDTGGFIIKEAELLEVSVVSVPANQEATFQQVKSWEDSEYKIYLSKIKGAAQKLQSSATEGKVPAIESKTMTQEEIDAIITAATEKATTKIKMDLASQKAEEKLAVEKASKLAEEKSAAEKESLEKTVEVAAKAGKSGAEKLLEEMTEKFSNFEELTKKDLEGLKKGLSDRSEEVKALRDSKRVFQGKDAKSWGDANADAILDAHILGLATNKGWTTNTATALLEKASNNTDSGISVADPDVNPFENITSTTIERDIQNMLILWPLFRNIPMNSSTMTLPILPDSGYAEWAKTATGSAPHGNLDTRGAGVGAPFDGNDLAAKILRTSTLVSQTFLGDETEEDAILPILPLLRESVVRSHARSIENQLLLGGHTSSPITGGFDGLLEMAVDGASTTVAASPAASYVLTTADLLTLRREMGKYGVRPNDVTYIVSQQGYFDLLQDGEFQDANLVGAAATKLTGSIGQVYGSNVLLCDEYNVAGVNEGFAIAVNASNFVTTTLRGIRLERDRDVPNQRDVIVASQRVGFEDIIEGSKAVHGLLYAST